MKKLKDSTESAMMFGTKAVMIGTVAGAIICTVLLVICAFALVSSKIMPQSMIAPITLAIAGLSSFFAGYIAVKQVRERGLLFGAMAALVLFVILFLAGFAVTHEPLSISSLTKCLVMIIAGSIGGVLAVNKKSKSK